MIQQELLFLDEGNLKVEKCKGRLSCLEEKLNEELQFMEL